MGIAGGSRSNEGVSKQFKFLWESRCRRGGVNAVSSLVNTEVTALPLKRSLASQT